MGAVERAGPSDVGGMVSPVLGIDKEERAASY
jgi:hypothetical protein